MILRKVTKSIVSAKKRRTFFFYQRKQYLCTLINPNTICHNHYILQLLVGCRRILCGEVLDIDAITGGFNLQAAWTTGYVVGQHIGE